MDGSLTIWASLFLITRCYFVHKILKTNRKRQNKKRFLMDNRTVFNSTYSLLGAFTFMISGGTILAVVLVHAINAKGVNWRVYFVG